MSAAVAIEYILLFAAALAFEASYVAWARAANSSGPAVVAAWSVLTAALSLLGLKGALQLTAGWVPYLGGIGAGAWMSAYLGSRGRMNTDTSLLSKDASSVAAPTARTQPAR